MPNTFDYQALSLELLRGGIAPRRVRRIVHELRGHFLDLHVAALDQGMSQSEADAWAAAKLGNDGEVAREILSRPELQSWASRWPWAIYALVPPILFSGLVVALIFSLGWVIEIYGSHVMEEGGADGPHAWFYGTIDYTLATCVYFGPVALCALFCRMAVYRRCRSGWPIIGILVVCIFGGSLDLAMYWGEHEWTMGLTLFLYPPFPNPGVALVRVSLYLLLTLAPYVYWLRRDVAGQRSPA